MRSVRRWLSPVLTLLWVAWLGVAPAGRLMEPAAAQPRPMGKVGVWYIPFVTAKDEFHHWEDIEKRKAPMPVGGRYAANDPKMIAQQWRQMRECGVDFIVMDDTNTVFVDNSMVDATVRAWFDFMDAL